MAALVDSSFDAAFWFIDRALETGEYMQPQKLQRLLYLSQAYFAVAYDGRMLMPALFVANSLGPVEPGVFRLFETAIPSFERKPLPKTARTFLDAIWRRFGHHSAAYLSKLTMGHTPFQDALARGEGSVIGLKEMAAFYGRKTMPDGSGLPTADSVVPPRMLLSQHGQAVQVRKWSPPAGKKS